jgi:hypothetical protein
MMSERLRSTGTGASVVKYATKFACIDARSILRGKMGGVWRLLAPLSFALTSAPPYGRFSGAAQTLC